MTQQVRLAYRSKGLRPPVYVVTSLSNPQWEPVELHSQVLDDSELEFWRAFEAEEGEHQYKFRLGPGDWWALDESKPVVEDEFGNRNNIINVKAPVQTASPPASRPASVELSPRPSIEQTLHADSNPLGISHDEPQRPAEAKLDDSKQKFAQLRVGPMEPLTPPMTPDMSEKLTMDSTRFQPFPHPEIQRPASVASVASLASHYSDKSIEEAIPVEDQPEAKDVTTAPAGTRKQMGMIESIKFFLITLGTWMFNICGGGLRATGILAILVGLAAIVYKIRDVRSAIMPFILSMMYPQTYGRSGGNDTSMV